MTLQDDVQQCHRSLNTVPGVLQAHTLIVLWKEWQQQDRSVCAYSGKQGAETRKNTHRKLFEGIG